MTLGSRSTEPFEILCAYEPVYHELDGCATRESRETQGESQQDPHALPGAKRAFGLVLGGPNTGVLLMTVSSQRGETKTDVIMGCTSARMQDLVRFSICVNGQ